MGHISLSEIQRRLCSLTSTVAGEVFNHLISSDCWCMGVDEKYFRFDSVVLDYIENVVNESFISTDEDNEEYQSEEEIMEALMDEDIFPTSCSTCIEERFSEFSPRCVNCYSYSEEWEPQE